MTILEQYNSSSRWNEKVVLMDMFHLSKRANDKHWTLKDTALHFSVSVGLVSENIQLANAMNHKHPDLFNCESRKIALTKLHTLE